MEKVTGIGGIFFRAKDPKTLRHWYQQHLGVTITPANYEQLSWQQEAGPGAIEPFPDDTSYFGSPGQVCREVESEGHEEKYRAVNDGDNPR
jgi:glyoxylase I family protein